MRTPGTARADSAETDRLYRKRFESLVDCSIQGIAVHRNRRIVFANGTLAQMFGYRSANRLLGLDTQRLIVPEDRKRVAAYGVARSAGRPAPEQYEFQGLHRSGKTMWLEMRVRRVQWDGKPALLSTLVDITQRRQAELSLLASEVRFRNLVEGSLEGVLVVRKGKVLFLNQALARMFGFRSPADALRRGDWARHLPRGERARLRRYTQQRMQGRPAPARYAFQGIRKDGKPVWLEASVRVIEWHGKPAIQATLIDVSERKQTEERLGSSETLLRTVVDSIPHALFAKDRKGRYLLANRGISEFYGREPERIVGRTDRQLPSTHLDRAAELRRADREVLATGRTVHLPEVLAVHRSGSPHWRAIHKVPLRDRTGAVVGVVSLSEDITARKVAEEATRAERRLLESVLNAIPAPISFKDLNGRYQLVNRAFARAWRRPAASFVGHRVDDLPDLPPDLARQLAHYDRLTLRQGKAVELPEAAVRTRRGEVIRRILKVPVRDARGSVTGLISISEDITARKRAEADLVAAKILLEQILAHIPMGLSVVDKDLRIWAANEKFFDLLGFPRNMGRPDARFEDFIRYNAQRGEYGPGNVETLVKERVALARKFQPHRFERVRPGGPAVEISGNPLPGGGFITTYVDITERRQAEERLRAGERLLQTVLDSLPHHLTVKDAQGRYKLVNRAFATFWGQSSDAFPGRRPRDLPFMAASYVKQIEISDRPVLRNGQSQDNVTREVSPFGRRIMQRVIKVPVRAEDGRVEGVVALIEDVTERMKTEEDARSNRRLLQTVFDTIPHRLWVKDVEDNYLLVNHAMARYFGLSPDQMAGMATRDLPGLTAAQKAELIEQDRQVVSGGVTLDRPEMSFPTPTGEDGWVRMIKLPLRNETGAIVGAFGLAEDITDRKRAELEARDSRRLLQTVFDTIPHEMFVKDLRGAYLMVNHAMARFYGTTPQQMVGMLTEDLPGLNSEQIDRLTASDRHVLETGEALDLPAVQLRNAAGQEHWVHTIKFPLRDEARRVVGLVGLGEHITDRKRAEEELRASRLLLQTVFDTIPSYLIVKDVHGRFLLANKAGAHFEGLPQEAFPGLRTEDLPHRTPDQIQEILEIDDLVLKQGAEVDIGEYTRLDGQGEPRWLRGRKLPLRDAEERVTGLLGVVEDITAHKLAVEQLHASRRLLQTVFDALPLRVAVRDAQGKYLMVNWRMASDHQRPAESFVGHFLWDDGALPRAERDQLLDCIRQAQATGRPVLTPELTITLPGSDKRLLRTIFVPLYDEHGTFQGTLGIGEDITDRRKSEQALLQAQKLESLGVLAGGIAHDFNNLLVTIMGNASLAMLKLPPGMPAVEELQQIEIAGQRAADLCRQMLSYAGKGRIEKQPVSVNQMVQEMTQLLRVSLPKGVAILFRLMPDPPLTEADPTQIRQVIMNLVINAGEAIGENPGTIVIATGVTHVDRDDLAEAQSGDDTAEGEYVFLEVSDSGVGMDAETRARIFDPFFTTKFTGRGLGLASVLGIVRGHRGGLKVYSEVGKGTAFKVLLPIAAAPGTPVETAADPGAWSGQGMVLIIDDEQSIRSVAARMLMRLGFQVVEAADGASALEIVRAPPAPLTAALLDLTMPGLSGEETLRRLRRLDNNLPVILMSGYNERDVLDRFVGREPAGFLQKPFKLDDLRAKLRELFEASISSGATPPA